MDREDRVVGVVVAGQHEVELALVERVREIVHRSAQILGDRLTFPGQLGARLRVLEPALQGGLRSDLLRQAGAALEKRLGLGRILPQVGMRGLLLEVPELPGAGFQIKDDLEDRGSGS
jgi:hypothetical protein